MSFRGWCVTSYKESVQLGKEEVECAMWQREKCPTSGRLHFQMFILFKKKKRMNGVKTYLDDKAAHCEVAHDWDASWKYCSKESTREEGPWQVGNLVQRVSDLSVVSLLRQKRPLEVVEMQPGLWRSIRVLESLRNLQMKPREEGPTMVLYLYGLTGCGKSRIAQNIARFVGYEDVYFKNDTKWWCGYEQQSLCVWDEFRGYDISAFLQIMNYLPYRVETKGGSVHLKTNCFIMTSNLKVEDAFKNADEASMAAIKRRIKMISF